MRNVERALTEIKIQLLVIMILLAMIVFLLGGILAKL